MWSQVINEHQVPSLMLFFGLVIGLVYLFMVPPWQHYDEPTHFEHIWLVANKGGNPGTGDFDQGMRREVAASMVENDFFRDMGLSTNLLSTTKPIWIGISQTGSSSVYYRLAAIPLRFLHDADITLQLVAIRFVSLSLYLSTILAAYGIAAELTPMNHPLRWLLPLSILLLPGFIDIMTAGNDDTGAIAFFSLFLWVGIRLIKKGFSWGRTLLFLLLGVICFFTKNTVIIAAGLVVIPILFSIFRGGRRRYVWMAFAAAVVLVVAGLISWGEPAYWYRTYLPSAAARQKNPDAPLGDYVLGIKQTNNKSRFKIDQLLPVEALQTLNEPRVTVGAWMWADKTTAARMPILDIEGQTFYKDVQVTADPQFFSYTAKIKPSNVPGTISLSPLKSNAADANTVYFDGIVLASGAKPEELPPEYDDADGTHGEWGGVEFTNLVRNPSGEAATLALNQRVDRVISNRFPGNPSLTLGLLLDPQPIMFYYVAAVKSLAQSFWAKFGWGNVNLQGYRPYTILSLFAFSGLVGASFSSWRNRKTIPWDVAAFLGISMAAIWGLVLMRGLTSLLGNNYFVPVARYAYPVIIPTMLLLNIGWLEIMRWFEQYLKVPRRLMYALLVVFFLFLNAVSLVTISNFYAS